MTTVFLSGSRAVSRLNENIRGRISNIVNNEFDIVIGDANGADKAMQGYLSEIGYRNVKVYCSGVRCRNNLGEWPVEMIDVDSNLKGRDFYTVKDKKMAEDADFALVIWDGKSSGSISNVIEMLRQDKTALMYLSGIKSFETISDAKKLRLLLRRGDPADIEKLNKKLNVQKLLTDLDGARQEVLNF
ncbi:hypothetical protein L2D14_10970 [Thalassospiraceae bacterium LMO-JJ14]|nr:hypothetical protein L2D14_10970 [Thalassospiraceae bacterium LMO-JJ14]